jgi:hypothetical protein
MIYLYCADDTWNTALPVRARSLTPRCWFRADSKTEAIKVFAGIEKFLWGDKGRQFGAAGVRLESTRERGRLTRPAPSETLPELEEYLEDKIG